MVRIALSCLPLLSGIVVLIGWWLDQPILERLGTPYVTMNPASAISVALSALALLLIQKGGAFKYGRQHGTLIGAGEPRWLGTAAVLFTAAIVFCAGLLKTSDMLFQTHFNIDGRLFAQELINAHRHNHMAPNAALAFLLLSGAILLSTSRWVTAIVTAQAAALLCATVAFLALVGYTYGVSSFYDVGGLGRYTPMALHTALCILALSAGVLVTRHREGLLTCITNSGPAGRMAAIVLPASLLVPVILGWLRLLGLQAGLYSPEFGLSLSVVLNVATLFVLVWLSARRLYAVDLTRQQVEQEVRHRATHDGLTGLANRMVFFDRLQHRMALMRRRGGPPFAVFFLDLDGFKQINDQLGHEVGDQLLVHTARLLEACSRTTDTVARLGGDEFTILFEEIEQVSDVNILARRILQAFPAQFGSGQDVPVGISIGITVSCIDDVTPEDVLRHADIALYKAKTSGKGCYTIADRMCSKPPFSAKPSRTSRLTAAT